MIKEKNLEEIGLHPFSIRILQSLDKKSKTAKQISDEKDIPMGRIYEFLNDLIEKQVISQTLTNPKYYYTENLEQKIISHLDEDYLKKGEKYHGLLEMLETEKLEAEPIHSSKSFDEIVNKERTGPTTMIKTIRRDVSYPYFFYPDGVQQIPLIKKIIHSKKGDYTQEEIREFKEKEENQRMTFNEKNTKMVFSEFSINYFFNKIKKNFGEKKATEYLKKVKICIKQIRTFELRVSQERFPYHLVITDDAVILGIKEEKEEERNIVGTIMRGGNIVDNYESMFDSKFEKAEPFERFYEKLLKNIKTKKTLI